MNPNRLLTTLALAGSLALSNAQSTVSTAGSSAPPAPSDLEQTIQDIKNPAPWFSWGGDLRLRNEYFDNALSLGVPPAGQVDFGKVHENDYLRFRGRIWASFMPTNDLTLNVRLAAEPREFLKPATMDTFYQQSGLQGRYGIFDTLNVQWKKPLDLPATLTVGRQDIFLGDGWLVGDGTPEDGSFTTFLDAARLTYKLEDLHTTIDAIGLVQYARPDAWLPTIGPSTKAGDNVEPLTLTDQDEKGAILWVANKSLEYANLDGYFIYKHDKRINDYPSQTFGDNGDIYTLGGRLSGLVEERWKYSVEGAYQFGRKQDPELNQNGANPDLAPSAQSTGYRGLDAFGAQSKLTYQFKDQCNDQASLSFEFLSGDNPKTSGDEMFDVLWGRWPQWSEMYNVYSYVQETRVGQTANLIRFGPTWTVNPMPKMEFDMSYYLLLADQDVPTRDLNNAFHQPAASEAFTGTGDDRGQYLQAVLKYKFNQHLSGHLWAELLFPGDFYVNHSLMTFLRAEIMLTF
ncbi:MAG: alginate export family protein [Verrucomicrobiota bacterium]|jgi:hypothetical protein